MRNTSNAGVSRKKLLVASKAVGDGTENSVRDFLLEGLRTVLSHGLVAASKQGQTSMSKLQEVPLIGQRDSRITQLHV